MSTVVYEFGEFRLDPANHLLSRRDGTPVRLTSRIFDTLVFMVEHHGTVLDKERLMEAVWSDSIVEENNLAQSISKLRQALGEKPGTHRFVVTVPGRGYRFAADVTIRDGIVKDTQSLPGELEPQPVQTVPRLAEAASESKVAPASRNIRRAVIAALLIMALGAGVLLFRSRKEQPAPSSAITAAPPATLSEKSIAVLPFENLSDDKQNAYFADGVQDEILTNLAKLADLKVISRMSVLPFKEKAPRNLSEIAQQLGVAHLLEGSVQRAGNRIRVTAQLIATRTGAHEWAETYDRELADVFAIQSEIAAAIAQQLQAKISPREKAALASAPTADLAANALYVQAKSFGVDAPQQGLMEATRLLDEAVARDPQFVLAYCLLSRLHLALYHAGYDHSPNRRELANAAVQNAFRLQPQAGEVHLALARYAYYSFRDYDRARTELDLVQGTLPNDAEVYFLSAVLDRRQGRWSDGIRNAEHAVELDPRNFQNLLLAAGIYRNLRRYSESGPLIERAYGIAPLDLRLRIMRAQRPFMERADFRPLRAELSAILAKEPGTTEKIADDLLHCALAERDPSAAARGLAAIPADGMEGSAFVYPREWFAGLVARAFNDPDAARTSFTSARATVEKVVLAQPDYAQAWSLLGRIDAALGRNEDAMREGRRACELLPLSQDALEGAIFITDLAVVYAWVGEKDLALEQLAISARTPVGVTYGNLKLDPQWDLLRGDPRFDKIVASLAPKPANK
jgi:TolB-like protein/DNA-binding winged helix-turn-helix (wHTH) protein/Flp pilus assembly protein TadD